MHDDRALQETRFQRILWERVLPSMYRRLEPLTVEAWEAPGEPVRFAEARAAAYQPFEVGSPWGEPWGTTWFRVTGEVPPGWGELGDRYAVEAVIDLGFHQDAAGFQAEALAWTADGTPLQGIHPRRHAVPVGASGPVTLYLEAASNPAFPDFTRSVMGDRATWPRRPIYRLRQAALGLRDREVYHLLLDLEVLIGTMLELPTNEQRRRRLLRTLTDAFDVLDPADVHDTAVATRRVLAPALAVPAKGSSHRIIAVGHAHIDTAWLWPLRETERKCARTFASAVRLLDDDPDYRFVCSQAVQYRWIEDHHPTIFDGIRRHVAEGRWEVVGGMWVEPDMNLTSGESIVRQLVHGQRYFESRFARRCDEIWIPDVFGYPASLPQIFRAAGCDRFVTQKLSWNQQNKFPHSTFLWRGLDGSTVLTHFPPVDAYNAHVVPREIAHAEHNFADHAWSDWSLVPFGHGNGGGGPTREMVERCRRMADLDGMARIEIGAVDGLFEHIEAEIAAGAPIPVWDGELYFELHRGTLTTQARTKVANRQCEQLFREVELWLAASGRSAQFTAELDELWKTVLTNQFHDILPGSSITWVHQDAEAQLRGVAGRLEEILAEVLGGLAPPAGVANAATRDRREVVVTDRRPPAGEGPVQPLAGGGVAVVVGAPGSAVAEARAEPIGDRVVTTERSMANAHVAVSWDLRGEITSIIDLDRGRELIPAGQRMSILLAGDYPARYDAWDVDAWTRFGGRAVDDIGSVELVDRGPLLASVRTVRAVGRNGSALTQTVTLRAGSARLDIDLDIDWREDESLLSWHLPVDLHVREAACDIQFGHVMRPTHTSTSWDAAKFEVCAQRYVDLAEPGGGVAVLNTGRYGHSVQLGGITVSLLRAPKYPDPSADHGRHHVRLAVLPHGPGLHEVLAEAEALNLPLRLVEGTATQPLAGPVVTVDHPGVQLSAVKAADDGSADLIVRCYEACGTRSPVTLSLRSPIGAATRCDLMEEPLAGGGIEVGDGVVALTLTPFELVTLRLTPR